MPLLKGKKNVGKNIKELHKGPQYQKTKANHGKATADKQAVAVAMKTAGDPSIGQKRKREARQTKLGAGLMSIM